jgi:hypothetical protein
MPGQLPATLDIAGQAIPLVVRRAPRARRITLRTCPRSARIILVLPDRASPALAAAFLARSQPWLTAQVAARFVAPRPFRPGDRFDLPEGPLTLAQSGSAGPRRMGDLLLLPGAGFNAAAVRALRAAARDQLAAEAEALARASGRPATAVRVGDPGTRWGSCSSRGTLSLSWRLVLAPPDVRRAVVAHEVAHLHHFDHSPAFWRLAEALLGGPHGPARAWLRAHGPALHAMGREG